MEETKEKRSVNFQGHPLVLAGEEAKVLEKAKDFRVIDNEMMPMKFSRVYSGKNVVILSLPSLDTPVCDLETRRFNEEAAKLGPDTEILAISMDLPFAQKRWCGNAGVENVKTYSDYQKAEFGKSYGVLVKELRLLARAVFIIGKDGILRYSQIVPEMTREPDYGDVLNALKELG